MIRNRKVGIIIALILAPILANPIGDALHGIRDTAAWQVLPWVLLVVGWSGYGLYVFNRRAGSGT